MARRFHGSTACWLDCLTARRLDGKLRLDLFFGDLPAAASLDKPTFPIPPPVAPFGDLAATSFSGGPIFRADRQRLPKFELTSSHPGFIVGL
jgi:hypothetical protein